MIAEKKEDKKMQQSACCRFFSKSDMAKIYMYIKLDIYVIFDVTETYIYISCANTHMESFGHLCSLAHINAFSTCLRSHKGVCFRLIRSRCRMEWLYCEKLESGQAAFIG